MYISDAIKKLEYLKEELGDLMIACVSEVNEGYLIEVGRIFEEISVPTEDGIEHKMVGYIDPNIEIPIPPESVPKKDHLKLIK